MFEDKKKNESEMQDQSAEDIGSKGGQTQSEDVDFEVEEDITKDETLEDADLSESEKS